MKRAPEATTALIAACSLAALCSCTAPETSARRTQPAVTRAALGPGVVAEVGGEPVLASTVAAIAAAQGITLEAARDRAVRDALFAAGAREWLHGTGRVASAERAALARALLERIQREVRDQGPPTDAEVDRFTRMHWYELDRPALARTVHAVVVPKSPAQDAAAKALAEQIAKAVAGVTDPSEFMQKARAVPAGGLQVVVQRLPPCAPDGRVHPDAPLEPGEAPPTFDVAFARAANAIDHVGGQSPVVRSSSGYHVILLVERIPALQVPLDERRTRLADEIMNNRAATAEQALLAKVSASLPVEVMRSAADLTSRVRITR